jgi:hypothetical protein
MCQTGCFNAGASMNKAPARDAMEGRERRGFNFFGKKFTLDIELN